MKTDFTISARSKILILLIVSMVVMNLIIAQTATVSNPIGVSRLGCTSGSYGIQSFNYNGSTNVLANNGALCVPTLASPGFSGSLAGDAFNPKDQLLYYVRTIYNASNIPTTYIWRWNPRTCPGGPLAVYQTLTNTDIAGLVFDANGVGYWMEFTGASPYTVYLRTVDFSTTVPTLGTLKIINLPAGVTINNLNGDLVLTPSGIMIFSFDDKLLTVNYKDYGTANPLIATYIGAVKRPTGASLVGLAYADGKIIASYSGSGCPYKQINILTGDTLPISYSGGRGTVDYTNITSGIGAAKKLVSASPTGTPGQYDLVYDILVKNFGNVPDSNMQVTDDLGAIYGVANVSNVSVSWVGVAPVNFIINSAYTGNSPNTSLFVPSKNNALPNYPVSQNNFTVRISCRVSSISIGVTYNNNAIVTANGYQGVPLRDVSTDGNSPDLNTNDKPDDPGEDKPTPFVISVAAETPPCTSLSTILYYQTFGTGTGLSATLPGTVKSQYTGSVSQPIPVETYTISNNANNGNTSRWISLTDRTGDVNGRMMMVNADVKSNKIFVDTINIQCSNLKYSFFSYAAFLGNGSYGSFCSAFGGFKYPRLIYLVRNAIDGTIITNISTPDITSNSWTQYGMKFVMPSGVSKIILEIYNSGEGGCGNDLALDDIQFGLCDPQPSVTASAPGAGCLGSSTTFSANMSDTSVIAGQEEYQWQISTDGTTWANITGATNSSYTIASVTAADAKFYRVLVAATGNILNATCRYTSNSFFLNTKTRSADPISATKNKPKICPMEAVILTVNGGSLGNNASWKWYSANCGGINAGTGNPITVNPSVTTTYFVRAEGDCNITNCVPVQVIVDCGIVVLDLNYIDFTANLQGSRSTLKWSVQTDSRIDHFEVQRSTDARVFRRTGIVPGSNLSSGRLAFKYGEDVENINDSFIYFRLLAITKEGNYKYSNVVMVRNIPDFKFSLSPNPAANQLSIKISADKDLKVMINIIDAEGKLLVRHMQNIKVGNNICLVPGIHRLKNGIYAVQLIMDQELLVKKLIIEK